MKSYIIIIFFKTKQKNWFLKKKLFIKTNKIIFPYSKTIILFFLMPLSNNHNFLFYPTSLPSLIKFIYIINYKTLKIIIKNISN